MRVNDEMVRAAYDLPVGRGFDPDDELEADVRAAIEAALAAAPPRPAYSRKRAAALRSREDWAQRARRNVGERGE